MGFDLCCLANAEEACLTQALPQQQPVRPAHLRHRTRTGRTSSRQREGTPLLRAEPAMRHRVNMPSDGHFALGTQTIGIQVTSRLVATHIDFLGTLALILSDVEQPGRAFFSGFFVRFRIVTFVISCRLLRRRGSRIVRT